MNGVAMDQVFKEIASERELQDAQWGGPTHDDGHSLIEWIEFIGVQRRKFVKGFLDDGEQYFRTLDSRRRLVKIAALAVAALEAADRKRASRKGGVR